MKIVFSFLIFFVAFSAFFQTQNSLGSLFISLSILLLFSGIFYPFASLYLLLFLTAYSDLIKRFLILWEEINIFDIAGNLILAPCLSFGICIGSLLKSFQEKNRRQLFTITITSLLIFVYGVSFIIRSISISSIKDLVTSISFLPLLFIMPILLEGDYKKLRKFLLVSFIIYVPVIFYAIWQIAFGYSQYEIQYMLSGLTLSIKNLSQLRPRFFSTLNSSSALCLVSSYLAFLLLFGTWSEKKNLVIYLFRALSFSVVIWVALYSGSRTGIFCALISLFAYFSIRYSWTRILFILSLVALMAISPILIKLIVTEQYWLVFTDYFNQIFPRDLVNKDLVSFNTLSARFTSLNHFFHNPSYWSPFGLENPSAVFEHDGFTRFLIYSGYVPLFISVLGLFCVYQFIVSCIKHSRNQEEKHYLCLSFAICFGLSAGILSDSFNLIIFPINFWFSFFTSVFLFRFCNPPKSFEKK